MKTNDTELIINKTQHFLWEYFQEAPDIAFTIDHPFHLTNKYQEVKEFIDGRDIMTQYNIIWNNIKSDFEQMDDYNLISSVGKLEELLFRSYHPNYHFYDLTNHGYLFPEDPEGWMGVEVIIDHPPVEF